ncbi:MAG: ribose 5-phosphate isomerase B [Christensenellaceae bacterium]|nr:ribose 5-phosphate isomerase B [Christensenellaceae bacterium]MBR2223414.1 ribose 5-phosphate isomerase B [Christensenellaceae bacterium]MBR3843152.1 ribose 5-phosphate isomerase B [Christensenellaceae bacterium]
MKVAIGNDHAGFFLKDTVKEVLTARNIEILDLGCHSAESVHYPIYGEAVGRAVVNGEADFGIVICGTGIGISIAANKVPGVRCGLCSEPLSAELTRQHNDANVLAMGARTIGPEMAKKIVETFLDTEFMGGKHATRVAMLDSIK